MRSALSIILLAGFLLAQRPASESYDLRIARLETTVPQIQKQLDEVNVQLKDVNKKLTDVQTQLTELGTEMKLAIWIGTVIGGFLILAALKQFFEKPAAPQAPLSPIYPPPVMSTDSRSFGYAGTAPLSPIYPPPVIYGSYQQPGSDVESLIRRLFAEERARNEATAQGQVHS